MRDSALELCWLLHCIYVNRASACLKQGKSPGEGTYSYPDYCTASNLSLDTEERLTSLYVGLRKSVSCMALPFVVYRTEHQCQLSPCHLNLAAFSILRSANSNIYFRSRVSVEGKKKYIYISDKVQGASPEHRTRKFPLCTTAIDHVFFFYDTNTPKEGELHERILYESLGLGPWNRQLLLELAVMQCLLPSSRKRRPGNRQLKQMCCET